MDKKVEEYIKKQPDNEKNILNQARGLILNTIPECDEFFQWGVICYCGGKIYLATMKNRIHVGFSIIGLPEEYIKLLEGSGKTARHIKIYSISELEKKNIAYIARIVNEKSKPPD